MIDLQYLGCHRRIIGTWGSCCGDTQIRKHHSAILSSLFTGYARCIPLLRPLPPIDGRHGLRAFNFFSRKSKHQQSDQASLPEEQPPKSPLWLSPPLHPFKNHRPKQHLGFSLKWRRCDGSKYNFLERLVEVARLLSKMVEPMLKAAVDISELLSQSFFMGFSLTILSLLARLRVLIQQILLDVVCVYNSVSSLSQKEQAIKITEEGFEVFREYYPIKEQFISLDCIWQTDKCVLVEKK